MWCWRCWPRNHTLRTTVLVDTASLRRPISASWFPYSFWKHCPMLLFGFTDISFSSYVVWCMFFKRNLLIIWCPGIHKLCLQLKARENHHSYIPPWEGLSGSSIWSKIDNTLDHYISPNTVSSYLNLSHSLRHRSAFISTRKPTLPAPALWDLFLAEHSNMGVTVVDGLF